MLNPTKIHEHLLTLVLICASFFGLSQTPATAELRIKKAKLSEINFLSDLIADIDKDKVIKCEIAGMVKGKSWSAISYGNGLSNKFIAVLKNGDVGRRMYVDVKVSGKDAKAQKYVFLVLE